eukprot:GEMP01028592.1.p1 GENE.GEMP01028592.1~~GEMP01028592.1.p1  ORF type:complete len:353 (+),score=88.07 GEMP01028592.1:175-1233(+)
MTITHIPKVIPRFWTGKNAIDSNVYTIDCAGMDLTRDVSPALQQQITDLFDAHGLVYLVNTGFDESSFNSACKIMDVVINERVVYKAGANPRTAISPDFYDVGAPLAANLHYHHEMVYVRTSPSKLGFVSKAAVQGKGETYVSDNLRATEAILATPLGQKLREKGICYIRKLTDRDAYKGESESTVYNHWQQSFLCETPEEAEKIARERGLQTEWGVDPLGKGRYLITKYYCSAFEYCPLLDRNLLYSSIADDHAWFDTWPGVMDLHPEDRPLKLTYGDDSELTFEEKQLYVNVYDAFGIKLDMQQGDIAIICNYRFAHGRPGVTLGEGEKREFGVVLGDIFLRENDRPDKW